MRLLSLESGRLEKIWLPLESINSEEYREELSADFAEVFLFNSIFYYKIIQNFENENDILPYNKKSKYRKK